MRWVRSSRSIIGSGLICCVSAIALVILAACQSAKPIGTIPLPTTTPLPSTATPIPPTDTPVPALVESFFTLPSTVTLQINMIDRKTLLKARANPDAPQYRNLIVRVWGFSARFVELSPELQDHVLARTEHRLDV